MVVPVNILLLPTENNVITPAKEVNSKIPSIPRLVPRTLPPLVDTVSYPLRAPTRPRLSITQLSAMEAKAGFMPIGDSSVLIPKNPGAATVKGCNRWLIRRTTLSQ